MKVRRPDKQITSSTKVALLESKPLLLLTFSVGLALSMEQGFAAPAIDMRGEASSPRPGLVMVSTPADQESATAGLTGNWGGVRSRLEDRGIVPYAVFATEYFSNVDGGIRNGSTHPGLLDFGVEMDLEKLIGWQGGGFTVTAFAGYGDDGSAENTGDFNVASNLFTDTDFNIFNLFVSQSLGDDFFYIKAGQIAADDDFMGSETAGLFLNSAFGPLPTESGNVGAPIFPLAAPGIFARINPSEAFSFHAGVYAGDAGTVQSDNHGFDWRTGGAAGWVTFVEADYKYGSGTAKLGGYYHTGDFTNFNTAATEDGLSTIYAIIDHRFVEAGNGGPGLAGFLRGSFVPQDERATVSHYFDGGIALDGVFCEGDALGVGVSYTVFGDDYLAATPGVTSSETILEMTYQVFLTDHWMIQPDVQWILDAHSAQNDAVVVGLRTELSF